MKKAYPCHLPGKELWGIHFHPTQAALLDKTSLAQEINPLWDLALRKKWIDEKTADQLRGKLVSKQTELAWQHAQGWSSKITWHLLSESKAAAGWMVLKNLHRARLQWISFRRPYNGLREMTPDTIERAIRISNPFEKFLAKEHQEKDNHILAALVMLHPELDHKAVGREMIGAIAIQYAQDPFLSKIAISHGLPNPDAPGGWSKPSMERVNDLRARLEKNLPEEQKTWIKELSEIPWEIPA